MMITKEKRVSYRAKAKDLDKEKSIEIESEKKLSKRTNKIDKIKIPPENKDKKEEKKTRLVESIIFF